MAALVNRPSAAGSVRAPLSQRASLRPFRSIVVRSQQTDTEVSNTPTFSLESNQRVADGYVEKDTAGQVNMFPTVMKPYEAGSSADDNSNASLNTGVAVGAGAVSLGLIALGLTVLGNSGQPAVQAEGKYLSLSQYSSKFSAELGIRKAAPAVSAVAAAPAVQAEAAAAAAPAEAA